MRRLWNSINLFVRTNRLGTAIGIAAACLLITHIMACIIGPQKWVLTTEYACCQNPVIALEFACNEKAVNEVLGAELVSRSGPLRDIGCALCLCWNKAEDHKKRAALNSGSIQAERLLRNIRVDFLFIAFYSLLLLFLSNWFFSSDWMWRQTMRLAIALIAISDIIENFHLFYILNHYSDNSKADDIADVAGAMQIFVWAKWLLVAFVISVLIIKGLRTLWKYYLEEPNV